MISCKQGRWTDRQSKQQIEAPIERLKSQKYEVGGALLPMCLLKRGGQTLGGPTRQFKIDRHLEGPTHQCKVERHLVGTSEWTDG